MRMQAECNRATAGNILLRTGDAQSSACSPASRAILSRYLPTYLEPIIVVVVVAAAVAVVHGQATVIQNGTSRI